MSVSTKVFLGFAICWQIAVGILYGIFLRYDTTGFKSMSAPASTSYYQFQPGSSFVAVPVNSTASPFPQALVMFAIVLLIVGLALIAAYIERASISSMAFTLLIFALTIQNFFIYRTFWNRVSVNDPNASPNFSSRQYNQINYINFDTNLQYASPANPYTYNAASFLEAIGAALALYAGFTAVIGRIGLGEVFFLSFIGTFLYEVNSEILWRLYIPDNGFASRAFAFGGALGVVSSLILGKKEFTKQNPNLLNSYNVRTLSFLGVVLVCCAYPVLVVVSPFASNNGEIVTMSGQVNIWLALAGSIVSCYIASMFIYRKFCVHDMVFASFSGAIAYSSSTDINYNPGAALAIGSIVGFVCVLGQIRFKKRWNSQGSIDTNGTIFMFLVPSLFAAIFSAILSGVGQSGISFSGYVGSTAVPVTLKYNQLRPADRSATIQGGFQMAGWAISIGIGAIAGAIIGGIYRLLDRKVSPDEFFNDMHFYDQPKLSYNTEGESQNPKPQGKSH